MRNIRTERPSKKLDSKWEGPFTVVKKINDVAFKLELPASMKIHPVFHVSLLTPDPNDPLPGQEYPQPGPILVQDEEEYEVEDILDVKKGRGNRLQARVQWAGWPVDQTWYPIDNFRNSVDILTDFYQRHPNKPRPDWLPMIDATVNVIPDDLEQGAPATSIVPALPKPPGLAPPEPNKSPLSTHLI